MKRAIWSAAALADFDALDRYYAEYSTDHAFRVGNLAIGAGKLLAENPLMGPVVEGDLRKWTVRGTDYIILYRPTETGVDIARLIDARRNWRPR